MFFLTVPPQIPSAVYGNDISDGKKVVDQDIIPATTDPRSKSDGPSQDGSSSSAEYSSAKSVSRSRFSKSFVEVSKKPRRSKKSPSCSQENSQAVDLGSDFESSASSKADAHGNSGNEAEKSPELVWKGEEEPSQHEKLSQSLVDSTFDDPDAVSRVQEQTHCLNKITCNLDSNKDQERSVSSSGTTRIKDPLATILRPAEDSVPGRSSDGDGSEALNGAHSSPGGMKRKAPSLLKSSELSSPKPIRANAINRDG
jgi:hypothetical protein